MEEQPDVTAGPEIVDNRTPGDRLSDERRYGRCDKHDLARTRYQVRHSGQPERYEVECPGCVAEGFKGSIPAEEVWVVNAPCLACGEPADHTAFPSRPFLTRTTIQEDGTRTSATETLPPYHLCTEHIREMAARRLRIGWCDDPQCRQWGRRDDISPCGQPFESLA